MSARSDNDEMRRNDVLEFVDLVLDDVGLYGVMYVGRRVDAADWRSVVIQTGEEGRYRLGLPDLSSPPSVEAFIAEAQGHLGAVLGRPVPPCPLHDRALCGKVDHDGVFWECPVSDWRCAVGAYEEATWPQRDLKNLAPILSARLHRRGITGVFSISVRNTESGPVACFGVLDMDPKLIAALEAMSAPLPVSVELQTERMRRVASPLP